DSSSTALNGKPPIRTIPCPDTIPRIPRATYSGSPPPIFDPAYLRGNITACRRSRSGTKLIVWRYPPPQTEKRPPMLDKSPRPTPVAVPNDLAAHWMPFTANRAFKKNPRLLAGAKDMHYFTVDGRKIIDGASGMWCTNAGHGRTQISSAIAKQAEALDYAPPFQFGIPQAFELASRIAELAPAGL